MSIKSLIINPGSTSTKIGVFEDETLLFEETLRHSTEEIAQYATIVDQKDFRKEIILNLLASKDFDIKSLDLVVGRGGMLKPIPGGTYAVSDELLHDLEIGKQGQHASNLGGILAREIGDSIGKPSFIVDPVVVDELEPTSRYSGVPELPRTSVFHALNQKAVAKRYAKEIGKSYDELNLIVQRALQLQSMKKEIRHLHQALSTSWQWGHILTNSPAMMDICKDTAKIALSQASVLISGESGTGKELIARSIHYNSRRAKGLVAQAIQSLSLRKDRPFVVLNCAALPESLL